MGLKQDAFADKIGISRAYLSQIETGREPSSTLQEVILKLEKQWREHENSDSIGVSESPTESAIRSVGEASPDYGGARARLKAARIAKGMTMQQLCKEAGYSMLIYRQIEEGSSNMSRKMAKKVAKVLGVDVDDLLDGSDHPPTKGASYGTVGETPDIDLPPGQKARYVPLIGMARCGSLEHGDMIAFDDGGYEHEGFLVSNPEDPNVFAVTLAGDSMMPVFAPGDVAVIYPNKPPRNGGIVLAKLNAEHGDGVMIKIYQQSGSQVTLSSYNAASYPPVTWQRKDFAWIYRVASVFKALS